MPTHEPGRCNDDREEETFPIETDGMEDFEVDPSGDFFGDYEVYSPELFGIEEEGYKENDGDSDDDEDEDGYEPLLEPDRLPNVLMSNSDNTEVSDGAYKGPADFGVELRLS
jgi:hypothetical protein